MSADQSRQAALAHEEAARCAERAIATIEASQANHSYDTEWAEVEAVDAAWRATETAWLLSRPVGGATLRLAQEAVTHLDAALMEAPGSAAAGEELQQAVTAHDAAAQLLSR